MTKNNEWADTVSLPPGELDEEMDEGQAYLVVVRGSNVGETFPVTGTDMVIGRGAGADLRVSDDGVSRFHCRLRRKANGIVVEDMSSRNGTYCNGERVVPDMRPLREGDRLQIGTTFVLRFTYVHDNSGRISSPVVQGDLQDLVTGAHSRRYFMELLDRELPSVLAKGIPLSLMLIHIDRYSELAASEDMDPILKQIAHDIRGSIHADDVLGRIAGGDFALLIKRKSPGDAFMLAERLRQSATTLATQVTLSLGVAALDELHVDTPHDLLAAAGSALHRARTHGGNRVVLCTRDLLGEPKR